ncbi:TPA: hypothetical protein RQN23_002860 [Aeromonas veronii]|nr:hypothetical protein [Aeromonas veronii]
MYRDLGDVILFGNKSCSGKENRFNEIYDDWAVGHDLKFYYLGGLDG